MDSPAMWDACVTEYGIIAPKVTGPCITNMLEQVGLLPVNGFTQPIRAIDLAAGPGLLATILGDAYAQAGSLDKVSILSTDFSPKMVEKSAEHFASFKWPPAQFPSRTLDAANLDDVPSNHYTHAFCSFGLMMMPEATKVLSEMLRVLEPSGTVGITTWKVVGWFPVVMGAIARAKMLNGGEQTVPVGRGPIQADWSDTAHVQKMLEEAGFQDVQVTTYESRWSFDNQAECARSLSESLLVLPIVKGAQLTEEEHRRYLELIPEVLAEQVATERDQPCHLPMIAIVVHGRKPTA